MAGKIVAQGEIANNASPPTGLAAAYAPSGEVLGVQTLLGSVSATPQTIFVYLKKAGGSATFFRKFDVDQYNGGEFILGAMNNGDEIQMVTNTDDAAYYTITAVEA